MIRISLFILIAFLLSFFSCEKGSDLLTPTESESKNAEVSFSFEVPPSIKALVAFAKAMVTAADMDTIVADLTVKPNSVTGTIENIPSGMNRKFEVSTYDADSTLTYYGSVLSDVAAGSVRTLKIVLYPVNATGTVIITGIFSPFPQSDEKIVFWADSSGYQDIFIMNPDTTELRNLTNTPGIEERLPRISPDKQKILYTRKEQNVFRPYIMDIDGTNNNEVDFQSGYNISTADWSPDGENLVIGSIDNNDCEIYTYNLNSGQTYQLTSNNYDDWVPKWSPEADWIAYYSNESGIYKIMFIRPDGTGKHQFMANSGLEERYPEFSPDGSKLLFYGRTNSTWDLFVVDIDGSNLVRLTNTPTVDESISCWSPDQQRILFTRFDGFTKGLYIYNLNDGGISKLLDRLNIAENHSHWR
ncbi:TolB family protein [Calditrichota bacterium]